MEVLESKIDVNSTNLVQVQNKTCTVLSFVDVIDTNVNIVALNTITIASKIDTYEGSFQETWTVIEAGIEKSCTVDSLIDLIESEVNGLTISVSQEDLDGTFTALDSLEQKLQNPFCEFCHSGRYF